MEALRIPASQFRSLPPPVGQTRIGLFHAATDAIPGALWDWRDVNPREVDTSSRVFKEIMRTLVDEPEHFFERNRGLTISAADVEFDDKKKEVIISLADNKLHGIIDGGHTLRAILDAREGDDEAVGGAHVFIKVMTELDPSQIAEIAGGLNRSQAVDLRSLENLQGHFGQLQAALTGHTYAGKIAYKMNDDKPIDVREILYYLAVFDCDQFNENKQPTQLFGRKEGIVRNFAAQAAKKEGAGDSFSMLISKAPDILELRDMIEWKVSEAPGIGRFKASEKDRIKSKKHRKNHLNFLDRTINGKVPLGWLMPMLGGFRANVDWNRPKGSFSWKVPNEALLDRCRDTLLSFIQDVHEQEKRRPEHVGRNAIAWRICYNTVQTAILEHQLGRKPKS